MSEMKFKYTIQQYQSDAVDSVVKVFSGQPFNDRIHYRLDTGNDSKNKPGNSLLSTLSPEELSAGNISGIQSELGFYNAPVALSIGQLVKNIQNVQNENNIKRSTALAKHLGACSLDVEMETGDGGIIVPSQAKTA